MICKSPHERLRLLPYYTGDETLEEALHHRRGLEFVWLEILVNGDFPWHAHLNNTHVQRAYEKACLWFTHFKTMIETHTGRPPLERRHGPIDPKEYRTFLEVLHFVSTRS